MKAYIGLGADEEKRQLLAYVLASRIPTFVNYSDPNNTLMVRIPTVPNKKNTIKRRSFVTYENRKGMYFFAFNLV